jgi:hypothetical protein
MKNYYKPGDWNCICDRCGFKFKASELKEEWTGLMVCSKDFETRHPSDLFRPPREQVGVPWTRDEPTDTFVSVSYITPAP